MAIHTTLLTSVRKIIVHRGSSGPCPDGRASAVILRAALPDVPILEMAYDSPEHKALAPEEGLLFCDFSPPPGRAAAFVEAGAIVLDHHHPDLVKPFEPCGLGVWGDNAKGESGALLAFREVAVPVLFEGRRGSPAQAFRRAMKTIAQLSAIRDTWKRDSEHWEDACELAAALCLPQLPDLLRVTPRGLLELAASVGPMLVANQAVAAGAAAAGAVFMWCCGKRVAVLADHHVISDAAEIIGDKADIVTAYEYVHDKPQHADDSARLVIHLRSRGQVDCQAIAMHFGGGGHKGAAGFPTLAAGPGPYERIRERMTTALDRGIGL